MTKKEQDARERIISSAIEILYEVSDIEKITVRQIAERANVGIGTINYHFNSKDNLLSFAIGEVMANRVNEFLKPQKNSHQKSGGLCHREAQRLLCGGGLQDFTE